LIRRPCQKLRKKEVNWFLCWFWILIFCNYTKVTFYSNFLVMNKVYGCVVSRSDYLIRKERGKFDREEYQAHPERYVSTFASEVNALIWSFKITYI
jgi:hypothetical protein